MDGSVLLSLQIAIAAIICSGMKMVSEAPSGSSTEHNSGDAVFAGQVQARPSVVAADFVSLMQ